MAATHKDAEIVLKLYELRREEVMRKARNFVVFEFWPKSVDEIVQLISAAGTEKNAYWRQVISFCEMSASLPLHGAVNSELFAEWNREILFLYAKLKPLLPAIREKVNPRFLGNTEKWITSSPQIQELMKAVEVNVSRLREIRAAAGK